MTIESKSGLSNLKCGLCLEKKNPIATELIDKTDYFARARRAKAQFLPLFSHADSHNINILSVKN